MAQILDGAVVRNKIFEDLKPRIKKAQRGRRDSPLFWWAKIRRLRFTSATKSKLCADLGIYSEKITPPATVTTDELLAIINGLNADSAIDGILVQMPLPKQVDSRRVLEAVSAEKDADGFHPRMSAISSRDVCPPPAPARRPVSSNF